MSHQELTEEQQATFAVLYGSMFIMDLNKEYLDALKPIIKARRNNHVFNKVVASEKANNVLQGIIQREFLKSMTEENKRITLKAIEDQKSFAFDIFYLDTEEQHRVKQLISKIKKQRK